MDGGGAQRSRRAVWSWVSAAVGLVLFVFLLSRLSWLELTETLARADPALVIASLALGFGVTAVRVLRWSRFFPAPGRWLALYGSFALIRLVNYVLPFRSGELAGLGLLRKRRLSPVLAETLPVWMTLRLLELLAIVGLLTVGLLLNLSLLGAEPRLGWLYGMLTLATLVALAAFVILARRVADRKAAPSAGWLGRRTAELRVGLDHIRSRRTLAVTALFSLALWSLNIAMMAVALMAFEPPLSPSRCLLAGTVTAALNLLPIRGPLGLGTADAVWSGVLVLFGVGASTAIALAFGVRLVQMLLVALDGLAGVVLGLGTAAAGNEP